MKMETLALVAPVTALKFIHDTILLTGEGPILTAYSLRPRPKAAASLSVLRHCRIHEIRHRCHTSENEFDDGLSLTSESNVNDVAVFGGKALRLVRLHVDLQGGDNLRLEILSPLIELQDWILDVHWLSKDKGSPLCVALAHNNALLLDVKTGTQLFQRCCLDGCLLYSALLLVQENWADAVLVGGTVFNQLILWRPGSGGAESHESKAPVERRLLGHSGVIFNISYLREKGLLASASDDRSVRVWAVGVLGVPGGQCGDLNPSCLSVLYGHHARVFSVCLSSEGLFSAGEDGTCLVWDWAKGGKVVRTLKGHRAGGVRALAVSKGTGHEGMWVATGGADGGVRLWRLKKNEKNENTEEELNQKLIDLKFPDHSAPKAVCITGENEENTDWSQCNVVVCTELGKVHCYSKGQWDILWEGSADFKSYCVMETVSVKVNDSTENVHLCAVGNLKGSIHVFPISHPQSGILLSRGSGKIHSLIWQEGKDGVCLLVSGSEGLVYRWCINAKMTENHYFTFIVTPLPAFVLPTCAKCWLLAAICLSSRPDDDLWVCGDRRGSLILFQESWKAEGHSALSEEHGTEQTQDEETDNDTGEESSIKWHIKDSKIHNVKIQPASVLFGVHGKQGVTSVCEYKGLLYSTGRDGCVRIFRVQQAASPKKVERCSGETVENAGQLQLEVLRVQRACKGMEWLERVLILEPGFLGVEEETDEWENFSEMALESKVQEVRFVIAGFHGVHFVVWDPVRQERLLAVPCGGGHRSWSLWPSDKRIWPGYGAVIFIKHGAVLASQSPGKEQALAAGSGGTAGWSLREGIHGRGIGCVCRLGRIIDPQMKNTERPLGHWEVAVTGGEDTSLTVIAVHPESGRVRVLSVITDHISSVRTVAAITREEPGSLSTLVFSAGGRAQMQCYRLLIGWDGQRSAPSCQVIQIARHRLDEQWERRRNRHRTVKMDPETRYMSIAVVDEEADCVLLALACSDGAVRLFSLSEVKNQFDLVCEIFYHQRCVLSVATCSLEDGNGSRYKLLFSAATDGKVAVWNLTEVSSSSDSSSNISFAQIPCLEFSAHQSGINSLAVWRESQEQTESGFLITVASGGDDGQLTVSRITVLHPKDQNTGGSKELSQTSEATVSQLHLHSSLHIPLAHAASLTDLKLLTAGLLVSTSSDQRVCLWTVHSTGISHKKTLCSHVADAAGLSVWEEETVEKKWDEKENQRSESQPEIIVRKGKGLRGEPDGAGAETGDPVFRTRDENESETTKSEEKGESVVKTEENEIKCCRGEKTGWLLVCGQGFQLMRVGNTDVCLNCL